MNKSITFQAKIHFHRGHKGRTQLDRGESPRIEADAGRIPRVSRLMALAIRFDGLIRGGTVVDQAELARLGQVTRARLTQIMNLLLLAPDIQETLLFLPRTEQGRDQVHLRQLQPITQVPDWGKQRWLWTKLRRDNANGQPPLRLDNPIGEQ
jgi:hypothetical protein